MTVLIPISILIIIILVAIITSPFLVFIHEMGHAIPVLLLTKDRVTIYLGSYGDPKNSLRIRIGRFEAFLGLKKLFWRKGLCVPHSKGISPNKSIIILISGPIASLLAGVLFAYLGFSEDSHGSLKTFSILFLGFAILDFFINIIPHSQPLKLHDGTLSYNDGYQLRQHLMLKIFHSGYAKGATYYNKQAYLKAAKVFHKIIQSGLWNDDVFRGAITSYFMIKEYETALSLHEEFERKAKPSSNDYAISGLMKSYLRKYEEGLSDFQKALSRNPKNEYALINRGYTFILLGQYENAIKDYELAIELNSYKAYSYSNLGLAKIKLGKENEGLQDINFALTLDKKQSYAYLNLGIYHFDKGEFQEALVQFEKAYELDNTTHLATNYIAKTKEQLIGSFNNDQSNSFG